jgi:ABC-type tungstate transport system permease subunit
MNMTNFTFTDRATWLAYRADWRARYKAQSQEIRATKALMKAANDLGQYSEASRLQSKLSSQRYWANQLMLELNEAKEFKAAQFAARELAAA